MKPNFIRRFVPCGIRCTIVSALIGAHTAGAADVTWDTAAGDSGATGGDGTWNLTLSKWTTDAGVSNRNWVNANHDTAVFGLSLGTVTLGTGISVGGLTFDDAYTLAGSTLTFGASGAITANADAEIASGIAGAPSVTITKTGLAKLTLTGTSTHTGTLEVQAGFLVLGHPTSTLADTAPVLVSGGTLKVANPDTVGTVTMSSGKISGVGILTGLAFALTDTGEIGAKLAGEGATLTKSGPGTVILSAACSYTGPTLVEAGTLKLLGNQLTVTTNLSLRLDATSLTGLTDGAGVSTWNDLSGNNRNASGGGTAPTYVASNAAFNHRPTLRFNGSSQYLNVDLGFMANSSYTIFAVTAKSAYLGRSYFLGNNTGAFNQTNRLLQCGWVSDTTLMLAQYSNDLKWESAPAYTGSEVACIYGGEFNASSGHYLYYNDVLRNSNANTTALSSSSSGAIGKVALARGGGSIYEDNWFAGDIAEILVYKAALNDTDRQSVDSYLNGKWGLGIDGLPAAGGDDLLPVATALSVAADAILDLNGANQQVAMLASGSGTVENSNSQSVTFTLSPGDGGTRTFAGALAGGAALGALHLVMNGTGTQILAGTNTYTGTTTVKAGTLTLSGAGSTYSGSITVTGGTLTAGAGAITTLNVIGGTANLSNPVTAALATVSGGQLNLNATVAALTVTGGTLRVTGLLGTAGTADFSAATGTTDAGSYPLAVTNQVKLATNLTITLGGGGSAFALSGANLNSPVGSRTLTASGGTLTIANPASAGLSATHVAVTATSGLALPTGATSLGDLSLSGSGTQLTLSGSGATGASFASAAAIETSSVTASVPITLRSGNVSVGGTKTLTLNATLSDGATPTALNLLDSGTLVLCGTNTYTGNTSVAAGSLVLAAGGGLKFVITDASANHISGSGSVTLDGSFTLDTSAVTLVSGSWPLVAAASQAFGGSFTVTGFTPSADGITWTKTEGAKIWVFNSASGVLTLSGAVPDYAAWATFRGLTGAAGSDRDPAAGADPDKDGHSNFEEYAFDGDPRSGVNAGKIIGKVVTLPSDGSMVFVLTVPVRRDANFNLSSVGLVSDPINGVIYTIQGSATLGAASWILPVSELPNLADIAAIQAGLPALSDINGDGTPDWTYRCFRTLDTVSAATPRVFLRATAAAP